MLLAKWWRRRSAKAPQSTLFVVIGAQRLHCGVMSAQGRHSRWTAGSVLELPIEAVEGVVDPLLSVLDVLQRIELPAVKTTLHQVRVIVADRWLAAVGVPWSARSRRATTADADARSQLLSAGFSLNPGDSLRLDDAAFGMPRFVVAYPSTLLAALRQLADGFGARLSSVLPLSVVSWEQVRSQRGLKTQVVAVRAEGLMLFSRAAGVGSPHLNQVTVRVDTEDGGLSSLRAAWERLRLRDARLAGVEQLALLDLTDFGASQQLAQGPVPLPFVTVPMASNTSAWEGAGPARSTLQLAAAAYFLRHPLDAVPAAHVRTGWHWLAAAGLAMLAGGACVQASRNYQAAKVLAAQLQVTTHVVPPPARPILWSRSEQARVQAVNMAIRELNLPIAPILRALEPPKDIRVAVLAVETAAGTAAAPSSSLKIVAEARTGEEMARYVAFMAERKPLLGAYLTRHEIVEGAAERPYRFTVEAQWTE